MNTRLLSKRGREEASLSSDRNDAKKSRRGTNISLFNSRDIRQALLPTLDVILSSKLSKSFRIQLSAIRDNLSSGHYADARDYVEDVWSTFENFWLSKPKSEYYTKLAEKFKFEINPVMQSLGYCCGHNYRFAPQKLCCSLEEDCSIAINAHYLTDQTRHNICEKCFTGAPGDTVTLAVDSSSQTRIRKNRFVKAQNNVSTPEPLVDCRDCGRRQHKICVLYSEKIWSNGFVCDNCLVMKGAEREENRFRAKDLPVTKLDSHIQARVEKFLEANKFDGGRVHIRMLLNANQKVTVKPHMRKIFVESGELSELFPYRSKAIFAFQEIDDVDVCIFGMYLQEYGSECPNPNTRRVYVEFLDSVNLFQPKHCRTSVYHEILLGYMEFAKQLGYVWLHVWACPPPLGQAYIFYNQPDNQKIPDERRLQQWYTEVFRKGKNEHIIANYTNILQQTKEDKVAAVARLPYFDEDYWPYFFEETLGKMNNKSKTVRRKKNRQHNWSQQESIARINRQKSSLRSKLFSTMTEVSENFFSVQLHSAQSTASLPPIRDPDNLMDSAIMYGHSAFFDFTRDNNYEFSSLRRAQFSTMCILYELHNQGHKNEYYKCDNCQSHADSWYHCTVCEDYDLCAECKEETGHAHEMDKMGFEPLATIQPSGGQIPPKGIIDVTPPSASPVDTTEPSITAAALSHAFKCTDRSCQIASCQTIKYFSCHVKTCQKTDGRCHICKTVNTVNESHSDGCQNANCSYSFCKNSNAQMLRQQQQQREKEHNDTMITMAATLQKMSLKILDNSEAWSDHQFMLNLGSDFAQVQMQLQKILGTNYAECAVQIQNVATAI